tara:strand:- start:381 stop:803 length:423 start_codon:yes stop_codon:yes gene_type:complete
MSIRKFEQDAIVNEIMVGVDEKIDEAIKKAEKTAGYKVVKKQAEEIEKLVKEKHDLQKLINIKEAKMNNIIDNYNTANGLEDTKYNLNRYYNANCDISWYKNTWHTRDKVANKLAIALLDPRAQDRIRQIIEAISTEVAK